MKHTNKWTDAYMDTAERFSQLSTAVKLKVGSIIVKDDRIISIGYNGMPSGWTNECEIIDQDGSLLTKDEVIHAEANAIAKLAKSHESGENAEMYCTHSPCIHCAKQIYAAGINKVYYKEDYRSSAGINFLKECGIEVNKYNYNKPME